jgi:uncharacterized protein (TIGR03067 family)
MKAHPSGPVALPGIWEMIRAERDGATLPELPALRVELRLTADGYTVRMAGQVADRGTYIHATAGPHLTLVLTGVEGPNAGRSIPCICQLAGNRLRICYGLDGTPPADFTTAAGAPRYLATYRRAGMAPTDA